MAQAQGGNAARPRPISPHLQIYSPLINMVMSILHRITGAANYAGSLLLAIWLISAGMGPEAFAQVNAFFGSVIGRLILVVYTWSLMHHMMGGIRHLIWDTGRGFDLKTADFLCWATIVLSVVLTALIWLVAGLG
jgi:succinate dehydrogenase / fumarate reductase cytochrome b subunit